MLAAIRMIRDVDTPLLQYFEGNLPHLIVSRTKKDGSIEVKREDKDSDFSMKHS